MYSYIARQPIVDLTENVFGYELLFRDGFKNAFPRINSSDATNKIIENNFVSKNIRSIIGLNYAFVNFPQKSLLSKLPLLLNKERLIIEILEECIPNDALFDAIKSMYAKGYTFALDDFIPNNDWIRFFPFISIIKFDITQISVSEMYAFICQYKDKYEIKFLAERVETKSCFLKLRNLGFSYFQGYYFKKPEIIKHKTITSTSYNALLLLKEVSKTEFNFVNIEKALTADIGLAYKLLLYVNSLKPKNSSQIESFKQALIYLGEIKLRKFIYVIVAAEATSNKPIALLNLSMQRAKFCELIANDLSLNIKPETAFLTGLFSLISAILNIPNDQISTNLPLKQEILNAIIEPNNSGNLGALINICESFENANWQKFEFLCQELNLDEKLVSSKAFKAQVWSEQIANLRERLIKKN